MAYEDYCTVNGVTIRVNVGAHNEPRPCLHHDWELVRCTDDFQTYRCHRCGETMTKTV